MFGRRSARMAQSHDHEMTDSLPRRAALSAPLAALLPVPLGAAPPEGRARGQGQGGGQGGTVQVPAFTPDEIARIRAWFVANPGFHVQPLPPGIARNLARGKPLPPGIAKRYAPPDLVRLLTGRTGVEYLVVGASLVLVQAAGGIVRDIVQDAIRR
jgi:hypothetical protein